MGDALDVARDAGQALDIAEEFRHMTLQVIGEAGEFHFASISIISFHSFVSHSIEHES